MKRPILCAATFILAAAFASGTAPSNVYAQHEGHTPREEPQKDVYYCPMHPTYTSDKPGDCPICNMKLVKRQTTPPEPEAQGRDQKTQDGQGVISISAEQQQLIGVKTDKVIYRPLTKTIRTVGRVAFDPELFKAQQEYIETLATLARVKESGSPEAIRRAESLANASRLKLKLQGLDDAQVDALAEHRKNDETLLISSADEARAWVYATVYQYEFNWVKTGQNAAITSSALPGREFSGTVVAIDRVFDAATRSVRARILVDNPDGLLKPEMYVDIAIASDRGARLAVPKEAVMDSGLRKIAFVSLGNGKFKPVEITTGLAAGDYVEVASGLHEGDLVVVSGNFLVDSESRLKSALAGADKGHQHGE